MAKLKVGIVGCGTIFHYHYAFIRSHGGATFCGVADRDEKALKKIRDMYGIEHCYTDLEEMIRTEGTDVIHITTPPQTHAALAETAIRNKNHVLIEKPMTLDYGSAARLYDLAKENNVSLCVDHNHLFDPWMLKGKEALKELKYEDIVYVESYYGINAQIPEIMGYRGADEISWIFSLPGGLFHDFIAHPLYLMLEYTGKPLKMETMAKSRGALFQDLTDELHIMVEGENAFGKLTISFNAKPFQHFVRVYHKKTLVNVDFNYMTCVATPVRNMPGAVNKIVNNVGTAKNLTTQTFSNVFRFVTGKLKPYSGMQNLIHGFYDSIIQDKEPPVTQEKVLNVMRTIDDVWKDVGKVHPVFENVPAKVPEGKTFLGRVLITGAGGFLGRRLTEVLVEKGYFVRVLVRKLTRLDPFKALGVDILLGDVRDEATLANAMSGMDYVVHAAANQEGEWETFEESTIRGTEKVFTAAREAKVKRIVYISSMSVYQMAGLKSGAVIVEDSMYEKDPQARGFYTASKLEAEKVVLQLIKREGTIPTVVLRPATIYGPRGPVFTPLIGISLFDKIFAILGKSGMRLPLVYIDNLIDAIIVSLDNEKATGQVFNVIDDDKVTKWGYLTKLKAGLFPKSFRLPFPYWFIYSAVWFQEVVFRMMHRNPVLTRYRLSSATTDINFSNVKIKRELKWSPRITLEEGLAKTFAWYRENA
jgi:nucleoside-diphosphate-sugar epimerase/predicted dehydrogenase